MTNKMKAFIKNFAKERIGISIEYATTRDRLLQQHRDETSRLVARLENVRSIALNGGSDDLLTDRLLSHPMRSALPNIHLRSVPPQQLTNRVAVAERLLAAYHHSLAEETTSPIKRQGEDMWTGIISRELPDLMAAIESRDAVRLADHLRDFGRDYVWFGGVTTSLDGYNRNLDQNHVAITYWDKLIRLAEYLGLRPVELPESGPWGEALTADPDALVDSIEDCLGISIFAPLGIIHTDGLDLKKGVLHYRHINSLYSAVRLSRLALLSPDEPSCCEFGGGIGLTALYARRLGLCDYTIFDLPITCVLIGHLLIHSCGWDSVVLAGEEDDPKRIKILPYWHCLNTSENRFFVTLNQDGMNEIDDNIRDIYRVEIKRMTKAFFLSLNHECFFPKTVGNLLAGDNGYLPIHRSPYWAREGYVEELFAISGWRAT